MSSTALSDLSENCERLKNYQKNLICIHRHISLHFTSCVVLDFLRNVHRYINELYLLKRDNTDTGKKKYNDNTSVPPRPTVFYCYSVVFITPSPPLPGQVTGRVDNSTRRSPITERYLFGRTNNNNDDNEHIKTLTHNKRNVAAVVIIIIIVVIAIRTRRRRHASQSARRASHTVRSRAQTVRGQGANRRHSFSRAVRRPSGGARRCQM